MSRKKGKPNSVSSLGAWGYFVSSPWWAGAQGEESRHWSLCLAQSHWCSFSCSPCGSPKHRELWKQGSSVSSISICSTALQSSTGAVKVRCDWSSSALLLAQGSWSAACLLPGSARSWPDRKDLVWPEKGGEKGGGEEGKKYFAAC